MAKRSIREWQNEFLKLYAEAKKDLGVLNLGIEIWSEHRVLMGYGIAKPQETKDYCEITIK